MIVRITPFLTMRGFVRGCLPNLSGGFTFRPALIAMMLLAMMQGGCAKYQEHRWRSEAIRDVSVIVPGKTTQDEVQALFGSPTVTSILPHPGEGPRWFYIHTDTERVAFLRPDVVRQQVIELWFDTHHRVQRISQYDEGDIRMVTFASEHISTNEDQISLFDQIVGNIGRFTAPNSVHRHMRDGVGR